MLKESFRRVGCRKTDIEVSQRDFKKKAGQKSVDITKEVIEEVDVSKTMICRTFMKLFKKWIGNYNNVAPHFGLGMKSRWNTGN